MVEANCSVCEKGYIFADLFCMILQRGADSSCKNHQNELICMKCGGFDIKNLVCPYCKRADISLPTRILAEGKHQTIRQCYSCLRVFNPDGKAYSVFEEINRNE